MKALILLAILAGSVHAVDPGLYHDPNQPGHGVSVSEAPDDFRVLTWYTHGPLLDADGDAIDPAQAWFISDNWQPGTEVNLFRGSGYFPAQLFSLGDPVGTVRVTEQDDRLRVDYQVFDWPRGCDGTVQVGRPWCSGTLFLSLLALQ
jgi:hypothetical protein